MTRQYLETYRVHFDDGTSALIDVDEDEIVMDVAVALCESLGVPTRAVTLIRREAEHDVDVDLFTREVEHDT